MVVGTWMRDGGGDTTGRGGGWSGRWAVVVVVTRMGHGGGNPSWRWRRRRRSHLHSPLFVRPHPHLWVVCPCHCHSGMLTWPSFIANGSFVHAWVCLLLLTLAGSLPLAIILPSLAPPILTQLVPLPSRSPLLRPHLHSLFTRSCSLLYVHAYPHSFVHPCLSLLVCVRFCLSLLILACLWSLVCAGPWYLVFLASRLSLCHIHS